MLACREQKNRASTSTRVSCPSCARGPTKSTRGNGCACRALMYTSHVAVFGDACGNAGHLWRKAKVGKFVKQAEASALFANAWQASAQISPPCTAGVVKFQAPPAKLRWRHKKPHFAVRGHGLSGNCNTATHVEAGPAGTVASLVLPVQFVAGARLHNAVAQISPPSAPRCHEGRVGAQTTRHKNSHLSDVRARCGFTRIPTLPVPRNACRPVMRRARRCSWPCSC